MNTDERAAFDRARMINTLADTAGASAVSLEVAATLADISHQLERIADALEGAFTWGLELRR